MLICSLCLLLFTHCVLFYIFQKRRSRPISKLLNPFCGGAGYSLAVALNFTQTKTEMPKTKQSSISAFFTAHRKGKHLKVCRKLYKDSSFSHFRPVSNYKWTQAKTASPRKQTGQLWEKAAKEESSAFQIKRTKLISSPLKRRMPQQRSRELDEDSLATLFTQDSEGFRVIAHRGLDTRSPLKDQSNVSMGVVSAYKFLPEEEEEDEEMLFTQDSQGNVVIKH
uniref:Uncharacterized protein n=1 Tax=Oreochromis niloticus TaxID=8128 RepID=A0A669D182_ORENI